MKTTKEIINKNTEIIYFEDSYGREGREPHMAVKQDNLSQKWFSKEEILSSIIRQENMGLTPDLIIANLKKDLIGEE